MALRVLAEYHVANVVFRWDGERGCGREAILGHVRHDSRIVNNPVIFNFT